MRSYKIKINNDEIEYEYRKNRGRRMSISIKGGGRVVVSAPRYASHAIAEKFLHEKKDWLFASLEKMKARPLKILEHKSRAEYLKLKGQAREIIMHKVEELNKVYNFKYNRIAIRDQGTRWGSCSAKKNLNFNYKLIKLPDFAFEYVIAHELCHLKEFNHSKKFWDLVKLASPDFKKARKLLREI